MNDGTLLRVSTISTKKANKHELCDNPITYLALLQCLQTFGFELVCVLAETDALQPLGNLAHVCDECAEQNS